MNGNKKLQVTRISEPNIITVFQLNIISIGNYKVREVLMKNRTCVWRNVYNAASARVSLTQVRFFINTSRTSVISY